MEIDTHRDSIAKILDRIADEGLDGPRDLDVALDAILSEERAYINRQQARIEELEAWKLAVDHRLVTAGRNTADSYSTPAEALDALIKQEITLATDPLINGGNDDHE